MAKRVIALAAVLIMLLSATAVAVTPRAVAVVPELTFDGNQAICIVTVVGNTATEMASAMM